MTQQQQHVAQTRTCILIHLYFLVFLWQPNIYTRLTCLYIWILSVKYTQTQLTLTDKRWMKSTFSAPSRLIQEPVWSCESSMNLLINEMHQHWSLLSMPARLSVPSSTLGQAAKIKHIKSINQSINKEIKQWQGLYFRMTSVILYYLTWKTNC